MTTELRSKAESLRHDLHRYPELSGCEKNTAERIDHFIRQFQPDEVVHGIGGNGLAAIYDSGRPGPATLFRAELDALPIPDPYGLVPWNSLVPGTGHKCGHDGHMAIVASLAGILHDHPPSKGKIILLFQPAEETGQGAYAIVRDPSFKSLNPDYVFAVHNLPGFPRNQVVLRKDVFAAASTGVEIRLNGSSSHAAFPEEGNSPASAMAGLIGLLTELPSEPDFNQDFCLVTIIHACLGEIAFGTNPGHAVVMATLRSYDTALLNQLQEKVVEYTKLVAIPAELEFAISWREPFPATVNRDEAVDAIGRAAARAGLETVYRQEPFRWSEDFGYFTECCKGAMFGLGAGEMHPPLHSPEYDFPDELIEAGASVFAEIMKELNGDGDLIY